MNPVLKKNFAVFPVLDWIATLAAHIPDKGEQLLRVLWLLHAMCRGEKRKKPIIGPNLLSAPQRRPALRECAQRITTVTSTEAVMTEYLLGTSCFSPHAVLYPF